MKTLRGRMTLSERAVYDAQRAVKRELCRLKMLDEQEILKALQVDSSEGPDSNSAIDPDYPHTERTN